MSWKVCSAFDKSTCASDFSGCSYERPGRGQLTRKQVEGKAILTSPAKHASSRTFFSTAASEEALSTLFSSSRSTPETTLKRLLTGFCESLWTLERISSLILLDVFEVRATTESPVCCKMYRVRGSPKPCGRRRSVMASSSQRFLRMKRLTSRCSLNDGNRHLVSDSLKYIVLMKYRCEPCSST